MRGKKSHRCQITFPSLKKASPYQGISVYVNDVRTGRVYMNLRFEAALLSEQHLLTNRIIVQFNSTHAQRDNSAVIH